jgi:UDP:flavonoid glycosyltransferase YjiC (YdhE family)
MGHDVLVATADHFVPTASHSGLPAAPSGPGMHMRELADPSVAHGIEDARYAHGEVFALMASRNLAGTLAIVDSWKPDVVVSERSELAGPIAAAARGIPYAELRWGVAELNEYRAAAQTRLRPSLHKLRLDELPTPDVTLNPWPPSLRLPHARGHLSVRHVPYDGVAHVSDWMVTSGRRPRICLTLGTVLPHLATRATAAAGLGILDAVAQVDCVLVVMVVDRFATHLRPLPAAVRHTGRFPLSTILPTCAVLISHAGQGTTLTALAAGCPQVVLPTFDDQIENAEAVVKSGAGLSLPLLEATPQRVAKHCQYILDNSRFGESASATAREISSQPTPVSIVGVLERLVRQSRSAQPDE